LQKTSDRAFATPSLSCSQTTFDTEIACVDVTSIDATNPHVSQVCAIGLWTDIKVILVRLPTLEIISSYSLLGEILPRSLLLSRFEGVPYLLVGLGMGYILIVFSIYGWTG
jgi:DNA damage-binding protein 1